MCMPSHNLYVYSRQLHQSTLSHGSVLPYAVHLLGENRGSQSDEPYGHAHDLPAISARLFSTAIPVRTFSLLEEVL